MISTQFDFSVFVPGIHNNSSTKEINMHTNLYILLVEILFDQKSIPNYNIYTEPAACFSMNSIILVMLSIVNTFTSKNLVVWLHAWIPSELTLKGLKETVPTQKDLPYPENLSSPPHIQHLSFLGESTFSSME